MLNDGVYVEVVNRDDLRRIILPSIKWIGLAYFEDFKLASFE